MKAEVGKFFFGRHRSLFGIWCYDSVNVETGASSAVFVKDCFTYEEAVREMYSLNGWGMPKNITRKF